MAPSCAKTLVEVGAIDHHVPNLTSDLGPSTKEIATQHETSPKPPTNKEVHDIAMTLRTTELTFTNSGKVEIMVP